MLSILGLEQASWKGAFSSSFIIGCGQHYTRDPSLHPVPQATGPTGFAGNTCTSSAAEWRRQWHIIVAAAAVVDGEPVRGSVRHPNPIANIVQASKEQT